MVAYTTTYSFAKPTVGDDEDVWGGYLNGNFDTLESLLKGTTALTAINVTGNITVGGTVDGRDVAADGSKLDGIESGATGDQTASEILTLIKTVDGAGSGLDADLLDGTSLVDVKQGIEATPLNSTNDLNTITTNGHYRWTSSVPTNAPSGSYHNMIVLNDGGQPTQMVWGGSGSGAADIHIRRRDSGTWVSWTTFWNSGNDGSGSGLDADTVDGIQASSFLRSDANDTYTGTLTFGSGTSAIYGSDGFPLVQVNTSRAYFGSTSRAVTTLATNSSTGLKANVSGTDYTVWHQGNDGSGSGLDADLLDGQHGSYYLDWTNTTNKPDPTLTLSGDASGSATFTNLGNATLSVTVADDSHNHVISNVDGLQTALDAKAPLADPDFTGVASFGNMITVGNSGTRLSGGTDLLEIYGTTASFHMGVQDGSGRVQMRWNASRGTTPTYQVSNEPSARFEIVDVTSPTDSLWKIDYAGNGTAGNTISYSNIMSLGTSTFTYNGNSVWHAGNDGSGSGLDADLLDGVQGSSYLRSDANDTASGIITLSSTARDALNFSGNSTEDNRGVAFNGRIALSADYNDGWLRLNNASEFVNGIYTPGNLRADGWVDASSGIRHVGDTDTYLSFATDAIALRTGGTDRVYVNNSGVRIGDTGNGYFMPVTGDYGSIQIDGGAHNSWEGYSIGGRAVFMHDNSSQMGLYDDVNNHWALHHSFNGATTLYYDGSAKLDTLSDGVSINGNLYVDATVNEDWDSLSGTSVTCNTDAGGAFSLTMTGNTTFTFSGAASGWSTGFILQLTGNGGTVTWPASVDWAGGTAPDAPASGETDIYVFWTRDGGTTWYGVQSIDAAA